MMEVTEHLSKYDRDDLISLAKLCSKAERFDDMRAAMLDLARRNDSLTNEERNLLSVAFKNVVGHKRSEIRVIEQLRKKNQGIGESAVDGYLSTIRGEMKKSVMEVMEVANKHLEGLESNCTENPSTVDIQLFFYKMKGDYYRYLAETTEEYVKLSGESYGKALETSRKLSAANPIVLGLALNYSVYFYEIKQNKEKACEMAQQAFEAAVCELDSLPSENYKESAPILQLLRDNLNLWTSEENDKLELENIE